MDRHPDRRERRGPPPPSAQRNDAPPRMPFGCLRSADAVYELFERKTKIGRGQKCDVILTTSKSISSAHAVVLFDGGETLLRDLNSTNGTFVNNVRVHNDTYPLEAGDIIRFGCDVQSYRFEHAKDLREYEPRSRAGSPSKMDDDEDMLPQQQQQQQHRSDRRDRSDRRPRTAAAGYSNHRVRRSDSPESRDRGKRGQQRKERQQQRQQRPRTSGGIRRSRGENPEDDSLEAPVAGSQSPLPPPNVHRSHRRRGVPPNGSNSVDDLSVQLARAEGERKGRLEAELEELRSRLAESDGRSAGIRQYRQEARKLIRRSRHRAATEGGDDDGDVEGVDPDANVVVYRTAQGTVRERSPTRQRQQRTLAEVRDSLEDGDPFEYADSRPVRRDENGNDVRVNIDQEEEEQEQEQEQEKNIDKHRENRRPTSRNTERERTEDYSGSDRGRDQSPGRNQRGEHDGDGGRRQQNKKQWNKNKNRGRGDEENIDNYHDSMDDEEDGEVENNHSRRHGGDSGMRRARSSPLHNRSKSLRAKDEHNSQGVGRSADDTLHRPSSPQVRSERGSTGNILERVKKGQEGNRNRKKSHSSFSEAGTMEGVPAAVESLGGQLKSEQNQPVRQDGVGGGGDDDFMAMSMTGGGGDESMPDEFMAMGMTDGGDQNTPPSHHEAVQVDPVRSPVSPPMTPSTIEGEQTRMIKALQERLAIAEETQRNTLLQLHQMSARQKERDTAIETETKQAQAFSERHRADLGQSLSSQQRLVEKDMAQREQQQQQQQYQQPATSSPELDEQFVNRMMEKQAGETSKSGEAIDRSLSNIKDRLDDSMGRREVLRRAIEELTEKAVAAHVAKLENAEERHRDELQAMAKTAVAAAESRGEEEESVEKDEETKETQGSSIPVDGNQLLTSTVGVPSLTPSQVAMIDEVSERERAYMNQLDTAREAIQSMRQQLMTAEKKQAEDSTEMKRIAKNVEDMHTQEVQKMLEHHRATVASMHAQTGGSEPLTNSTIATLQNGEEPTASKVLEKSPSQAEVVLQSLITDMNDHEETSKVQMDRLRAKLENTETIHVRQLEEMRARHRKELELVAVGSTAATLVPTLTEFALSTTSSPKKGELTSGGDGYGGDVVEAMVTTRRAAQDLRHEANEYARPSPTQRRRRHGEDDNAKEAGAESEQWNIAAVEGNSGSADVDVVRDMKELADAARKEHMSHIARLKKEHREQLLSLRQQERRRSSNSSSSAQILPERTTNQNISEEEVAALRSELKKLRRLLTAASSSESPLLSTSVSSVADRRVDNGVESRHIERDVVRAAVLRPLVKGLHLDGLERGFRALVTEREQHIERQKATSRRDTAGMSLHCVAKRGARDLLRQGWRTWTYAAKDRQSAEREAKAILDAVVESGDAVRAQGLELYCVELQQRLSDMKEERTEQERQLRKLERMDWPRVVMRQTRTISTLQESIVQLRKDAETERSSFARAMQKAMKALDNATSSKKRSRRGGGGSSSESNKITDNVHNLQEFITDISRQVSQHREEALEWQRRHRQSTKAWVRNVFLFIYFSVKRGISFRYLFISNKSSSSFY